MSTAPMFSGIEIASQDTTAKMEKLMRSLAGKSRAENGPAQAAAGALPQTPGQDAEFDPADPVQLQTFLQGFKAPEAEQDGTLRTGHALDPARVAALLES